MQQHNIHKAKTTAKARKPVAKKDFAFKGGNSGIWTILIGLLVFFLIKCIAPLMLAMCAIGKLEYE